MCIAVFIWHSHPVYPFLLLLNRDELHNRPAESLAWWEGGNILGGRDVVAGGTWLACNRDGRFAFITNVREGEKLPRAKSRGELPVRFLEVHRFTPNHLLYCLAESKKSLMEFAMEHVEEVDQFNGFNLILVDLHAKSMVYLTNRPKGQAISPTEVSPGIHALSNASLDSPWPKAQRLKHNFKDFLDRLGEDEVILPEMAEKLMSDRIKDDESLLPGIYSSEWEYELSSVFVETKTPTGPYGTRSTSALSVKTGGDVVFYERYLDNESWKEHEVAYAIE